MRIHHPDLDWLEADLQPTERQSVQDCINTLKQIQLDESPEDRDWEARRARFMNGVLHFETTSADRRLTDFLDYQKLINSADEVEVETDKDYVDDNARSKGNRVSGRHYPRHGGRNIPNSASKPAIIRTLRRNAACSTVGMTRAQDRLYLTSVRRRRGDYERGGSMFLREIPSNLIEHWHPGMRRKR